MSHNALISNNSKMRKKNMEVNELLKQPFVRVILSNKKDKSYAYNKTVIVPMKLKGK